MIKGNESAMSHKWREGKSLSEMKSQKLLLEAEKQCHYIKKKQARDLSADRHHQET